VNVADLFALQDHLVERIVESLGSSLVGPEHRTRKHDVPGNAAAYEFYLRANALSRHGLAGAEHLGVARDLYLRGIEQDPDYAPAWARLGRCYVLLGKGVEAPAENFSLAESAFQRALELNPDLQLAHSLYARLKAETGRACEAMAGLLARARAGSVEPELFATLVQCCRYCGLVEASIAAHDGARRLDPQIHTSVIQTFYQIGDYDGALRHVNSGVWMTDAQALDSMGRPQDALKLLRNREQLGIPVPMRCYVRAWRALLEGKTQESLEAAEQTVLQYVDPEGVFYMALVMARLDHERALSVLAESVRKGFFSVRALSSNVWLDPLRSDARFQEISRHVESRCLEAAEEFRKAGGPQLLDIRPS
jgi:tetratricopeptide (TPR) repeat protein